ncbi:MAG: RidA family protein [Planctomycetes bacterium]|nr:RidA family protein [Planctomycetota bacterium]
MPEPRRVHSKSPYEPLFGFCRALRQGSLVHVAGTAPIGPDGQTVGIGDPAAQTRRCFTIARDALQALGADLEHVVRTRMFVTDIAHWETIGKVHGEFFGDAPPVSTMVEVSRLIDPDWFVEIEVEAWVP